MRYNSYPLNRQKLRSLIMLTTSKDVAQWTYLALQSKNWHDYYGKAYCDSQIL